MNQKPEKKKLKKKYIYIYPTMKILAFKNDYIKAFDANNIMGLV